MAYNTPLVGQAVQGVSIDNNRRLFNFGSARMAEISPEEALFVSYLQKLRTVPTDDPVFKLLERRHQWQRRNFEMQANKAAITIADLDTADYLITDMRLTVHYDKYGRAVVADTAPEFLIVNHTIGLVGQTNTGPSNAYEDKKVFAKITAVGTATSTYVPVTIQVIAIEGSTDITTDYSGKSIKFNDGQAGRVIGSTFAEGTNAPTGWTDAIYDREGYTQIFKTGTPTVSGTVMATRFRGIPDEYARIWAPKMSEHKMDLTQSFLFNVGGADTFGTGDERLSLGFIPYIERNGVNETGFTYAATGWDSFLEFLRTFYDPIKGTHRNKAWFTSRKILAWLDKVGSGNFIANSVGASAFQLDITKVPSSVFGHTITQIKTRFGVINLMEEVLLREEYEDYMICVDLANVAYRPLIGNGISRDTYVETNIQTPGLDGRHDQILTEAGLEINLPETHAVIRFA